MEHEIEEVFVRPGANAHNRREAVEEILRLHGFILEQLGNELSLIIDIIMAINGRFDDVKDEMECRFQEEDYKFEVVFEELHKLRRHRRTSHK